MPCSSHAITGTCFKLQKHDRVLIQTPNLDQSIQRVILNVISDYSASAVIKLPYFSNILWKPSWYNVWAIDLLLKTSCCETRTVAYFGEFLQRLQVYLEAVTCSLKLKMCCKSYFKRRSHSYSHSLLSHVIGRRASEPASAAGASGKNWGLGSSEPAKTHLRCYNSML